MQHSISSIMHYFDSPRDSVKKIVALQVFLFIYHNEIVQWHLLVDLAGINNLAQY